MKDKPSAGARKGEGNLITRMWTKLAPPVVSVFPIPGEEVFRSKNIFLSDYNLQIAASPREANVMLIKGPVPDNLHQSILVAYAQIPRPKVLVFDGLENIQYLPDPDLVIGEQENNYTHLKHKLEQILKRPFSGNVRPFAPKTIQKQLEQEKETQHEHQHHHGHEHGQHQHHEDHDHEVNEQNHQDQHDHGEHQKHKKHQEENEDEGHQWHQHQHGHQHDHDQTKKNQQQEDAIQADQDEEGHQHHHHQHHEPQEHHQHHEHQHQDQQKGHSHDQHEGHGGHGDHGGGMGFMSMVMMTKDIPRSMDGLPMEHNQAHFGPFFPGLPGGLSVQMMLDGDTVMQLKPNRQLMHRKNNPDFKNASGLPDYLGRLNPLAPQTWKILGERLINSSSDLTFKQIHRLENERIDAHLNWMITFSTLIGNQWMRLKAEKIMRTKNYAEQSELIKKYTGKILNFRHLKVKTEMVGKVPELLLHHTRGIVARAAGLPEDARASSNNYQKLGFRTLTISENHAWGRLKLILMEINQSLELIRQSQEQTENNNHTGSPDNFSSRDVVMESPFGWLKGKSMARNGKIEQVTVEAASGCHLLLAGQLIKQVELSDALVALSSFNINPWELNKIVIKNSNSPDE